MQQSRYDLYSIKIITVFAYNKFNTMFNEKYNLCDKRFDFFTHRITRGVLREPVIRLKNIETNIQFRVFMGHSIVGDGVNERTREDQQAWVGERAESCRRSNDFQESRTNRGLCTLGSRAFSKFRPGREPFYIRN